MENLNNLQFMNNLFNQEPSVIIDWVRNIEEKRIAPPQNFNWLGLAEACLSRTYEENNLLWARATIDVFNLLAELDNKNDECLLSIMRLRVFLINRLGAIIDDPILDFKHVVQWFFQCLSIQINEVQKIVENWAKLDIEQIKELRKIKNRLIVFKEVDKSLLKPYPELEERLGICDKLP